MLVLAGPGSGKTKVLTERIRFLIEEENIEPNSILVITFSKKAAVEMKNRFEYLTNNRGYPVNFGTFHAVFYHIISHHNNFTNDNIITQKEMRQYVADVGITLGIEKASYVSWQNDILKKISEYKNFGDDYITNQLSLVMDEKEIIQFKEIYTKYQNRCCIEEKIDFDDMIIMCRKLFLKHESVLRMWQGYYKYILVDEFQDINDAQYDILRLLAGNNRNVFAVGDDDQSIYAFRGARPSLMQKFEQQFVGCKRVNLNINYRCCKNIVGASNTLIIHNRERIERECQRVFRNDQDGIVDIVVLESTVMQAEYVCNKINELIKGNDLRYSDFAVLYRSGHCAKMFENICNMRGIPVYTKSRAFDIFEIDEIKILLSYLKLTLGLGVRADWLYIINRPCREISREALALVTSDYYEAIERFYADNEQILVKVNKLSEDLEYIKMLPPYAAIIYLLYGVGVYESLKQTYKNIGSDYSIDEILDMFKEVVRAFDTIEGFMNFVSSKSDSKVFEGVDEVKVSKQVGDIDATANESDIKAEKPLGKVNLMTAHASKGLEFKVVFVIGLQEGLFPHNKNLHGISVEEERRLMYVAMTRAKVQLYICALHMTHGKQQSRFIGEILENQSFINSYSSLSKNSSNASATISYSSSSSI